MSRNVTEPSFKFYYDANWYSEQNARNILSIGTKDDIKELKAEYTRMRDVAQKRIKRLGKEFPESKTYQERKGGIVKLRDLTDAELPKAFNDLYRFVHAKKSTVTGQRVAQAKTMATLNRSTGAGEEDSSGYVQPKVNKQNYWRVIDILNEAREHNTTYGSDRIVQLADTTLELSDEQFDKLLDHLEDSLESSKELQEDLESYMKRKDIKEYQQVDMDDFIISMGWG